MTIENSGEKKRDVKQVTEEELDNAVGYSQVQNEANVANYEFGWTVKPVVLERLGFQPHLLNLVPPELRADKEVVLASVSRYGASLEYASPELQNDKKIVEAAVSNIGTAIEFASPEMRANKEVVLKAIKSYFKAYKFVSAELKKDSDILKAMKPWKPFLKSENIVLE